MRNTTFGLVFGFLALVGLPGCGASFEDVARKVVNTGGETLAVVDSELARQYTEAARAALEQAETREQYEASMRDWNTAADSLTAAKSALYQAEAILNAWNASRSGEFLDALRELVLGVKTLVHDLEVLQVDIP